MRVAIYGRVSTSHQVDHQTIEQQLERLRAHVHANTAEGWVLDPAHVFRDDGYSGATLARPGLDRLRDAVKSHECDRVLVTAPDRLARKYVHQMVLLEEWARLGCAAEFLDRPMSDDPHDHLLLQIRGAVAEYERTLIAERMRRGRLGNARPAFSIILAALPGVGEGCAGQQMHLAHQAANQSLDVAADVRNLDGAGHRFDPMPPASPEKAASLELPRVVEMQGTRHPGDRPGCRDAAGREPSRLCPNALFEGVGDAAFARGAQRGVEAEDHPGSEVNGQGQPRSADGLTMDVVEDDDVGQRVVDLDHIERMLDLVPAGVRTEFVTGGFGPLTPFKNKVGWQALHTALNRRCHNFLLTRPPQTTIDLAHQLGNRRLLARQIGVVDSRCDDVRCLCVQPGLALGPASAQFQDGFWLWIVPVSTQQLVQGLHADAECRSLPFDILSGSRCQCRQAGYGIKPRALLSRFRIRLVQKPQSSSGAVVNRAGFVGGRIG